MKKIFVLSMLSLFLCTGNVNAGEFISQSTVSAGDDLVISFRFKFHRPKYDCQRGFGICLVVSMEWEDKMDPDDENYCIGKGHINERNQLIIEVNEKDLAVYEKGSTLPYFKDKTSISILDPYPLPDETCRVLGAKPPLTIKPGNYPVSYENGSYTVVFQL